MRVKNKLATTIQLKVPEGCQWVTYTQKLGVLFLWENTTLQLIRTIPNDATVSIRLQPDSVYITADKTCAVEIEITEYLPETDEERRLRECAEYVFKRAHELAKIQEAHERE